MSATRRPSGLTLVELIATLAIAALLLGVAVPSFSRFMAEQSVRGAATDLQTALLVVRSEALKHNARVALAPQASGWSSGWTVPDPVVAGGFLLRRTLPAGVTIVCTGCAGPGVEYRPSGRVGTTPPPVFCLTATRVTSVKRAVRIELSGQPIMQRECPH